MRSSSPLGLDLLVSPGKVSKRRQELISLQASCPIQAVENTYHVVVCISICFYFLNVFKLLLNYF